jgi:hypothetical protein
MDLFEQIHLSDQHLFWRALSGSRAYGLDSPTSDTDIKGVFVLPKRLYYGWSEIKQLANPSNDVVYYELDRFFELLAKNNPNILELLSTATEHVFFKHELAHQVYPEMFLSKLCQHTFANYAISQIKKAQGLNKKIANPIDKARKNVLDFCYIAHKSNSIPLKNWLVDHTLQQHHCGLFPIAHMQELYALFHQSQLDHITVPGIYSDETANHVSVLPVSTGQIRELEPLALVSFNKHGYSNYCREYKSYWQWVAERNPVRYKNTAAHGKAYNAKNMMHTFRLLHMAQEIAREHTIKVKRLDREFLLRIKSGAFLYDDLVKRAYALIDQIEIDFAKSDLPDVPDMQKIEQQLVEIRDKYYKKTHQ